MKSIFILLLFVMPLSVMANGLDYCRAAGLEGSLLGICTAYTSPKSSCLLPEVSDRQRCESLRKSFFDRSGGLNIDYVLEGGLVSTSEVIGSGGGTVTLKNVGAFAFAPSAFEHDVLVTVETTSDEEIDALFDEHASIFRPSDRLGYEVRISTGEMPPRSEFVSVEMNVPQVFLDKMPSGYSVQAFALIVQGSQDEAPFPVFELITSSYDFETKTITFELPGAAFSDTFTSDGSYQAIITLAPTPGPSGVLSFGEMQMILANSAQSALSLASSSSCEAASIACPVSGGCNVVSPFSPARQHPIYGNTRPHNGVDYAAPNGTPIMSAASGTIERSYTSSSYGETIIVRHSDGSATLYAHLQNRGVSVGDSVTIGQAIGTADSTGNSTGPHLHFEYVPNGQIIQSRNRIDPDACVDAVSSGSITVRDSGNLADDAFQISIDGFVIGQTAVGASNNLAISNLVVGLHSLVLTVVTAPDNIGTYTVTLNDGLTFADGSTSKAGSAPEGSQINWTFLVPQP